MSRNIEQYGMEEYAKILNISVDALYHRKRRLDVIDNKRK